MLKPQPIDVSQTPLQGTLNGIPQVQNMSTVSGVWYPVTLEFEESKQMLLQPRDAIDWYVSTASGGDYFTVRNGGTLQAPIVAASGTVLCWVMAESGTVFELLVGR